MWLTVFSYLRRGERAPNEFASVLLLFSVPFVSGYFSRRAQDERAYSGPAEKRREDSAQTKHTALE